MRILLLLFLSYAAIASHAQQQWIDVRESQIMAMLNDTSKVNQLNKLAAKIQFEDPVRATNLLQLAHDLSEQLNYDYGLSVTLVQRATLFFYEMKSDTAKALMDKAYQLVKNKTDYASRKQTAVIIQRYAGFHQQNQKYDSAVLLYQEAAARFIELNDPITVIVCYYNLSTIYNSLSDTENALLYARKTRNIAHASRDSTYIMRSYMALADAFISAGKYDSLYIISNMGQAIANRYNQFFPTGKFQLLLGAYYDHKMNYDSSVLHYTSAYKAFNAINLGYETSLALYHIGHAHFRNKHFSTATDYLKRALAKSKDLKLDQVMRLCLLDLAIAEENLGNFRESYHYLKEYIAVNDTIVQRNNRKLVYDLETKYQVKQKEAQLLLQQNEIRKKGLVNYLLSGAVISILIISFFMFQAFQQRRRLQEQRIHQLEQEKKLMASEAIIKGQEEERGRLAKDLHDGLGGLLSGVKFSLSNIKSTVVSDADGVLVFERALDMLDHSIVELRRVAHNLMPEVLVKFGLSEAVKSYCESVRQSGVYRIDFQNLGIGVQLPSNTEIILYRVIQELLTNAAKHGKCSYVLVQLAHHEHEMTVTVEDDGVGFDSRTLETSSGAGWKNIRSRIDWLKGKVDVQSGSGKGTSVHLSIPV